MLPLAPSAHHVTLTLASPGGGWIPPPPPDHNIRGYMDNGVFKLKIHRIGWWKD